MVISSTAIGNFMSGTVFKRRDHANPTEPAQKLMLRLLVARRTHRLDLSCRATWEEENAVSPSMSPTLSPSISTKSNRKGSTSPERPNDIEDGDEETKKSLDVQNVDSAKPGGDNASVNSAALTATASIRTGMSQTFDQYICATFRPNPTMNSSNASQASASVQGDDEQSVETMKQLPIGHVYVDFRLHTIPSDIFKFQDLQELWLDNHRITALPRKISELSNLEVLSVRNNLLESIPADLCHCTALKRIFLGGNKLSNLPNLFGKLKQLEELDISHNSFSDFPEVLTALSHLHILDISHNPISTLPTTMRQMRCLYVLSMENLRCSRSPAVLAKMPYLEVIGCSNLSNSEKSAKSFMITPAEDFELQGMLKGRAALKLAERGRRRKT